MLHRSVSFLIGFTAKETIALCPLGGIRGGRLSQYVYSKTEIITTRVMKVQRGADVHSIHSQPRYYVADEWSAS